LPAQAGHWPTTATATGAPVQGGVATVVDWPINASVHAWVDTVVGYHLGSSAPGAEDG
jgi:hypothetical protein